jgi:hypothetical protein
MHIGKGSYDYAPRPTSLAHTAAEKELIEIYAAYKARAGMPEGSSAPAWPPVVRRCLPVGRVGGRVKQ